MLRYAVAITAVAMMTACGTSGTGGSDNGDPTATAAPSENDKYADWQPVEKTGSQLMVPPDWKITNHPGGGSSLTSPKWQGVASPGSATYGSEETSEDDSTAISTKSQLASLKNSSVNTNVTKMPEVELNGVTWSHLRYETSASWYDEFIAVHDGYKATVTWNLAKFITREEADKLINQVMPTVKFTS